MSGSSAVGPPPGVNQPPGISAPATGWPALPAQYTQPGTNGFAVASLVLGCLFCLLVTGILAVIFGNVALAQIQQSGGVQRGRGLAIAGIVLGWVGVALIVLSAFIWLGYGISNA
jgi:uncharacterized protein DUF4190